MPKVLTDPAHYAAIADAIRAKSGNTSAVYTPAQMAPAIRALPAGTGPDLSGDTITADKLLYGYTAHDASGSAVTGTLDLVTVVNGAVSRIPPGLSLESFETDPSLNITKLKSFTDLSALDSAWSVTGMAESLSFSANGMKETSKTGAILLDSRGYKPAGRYASGISIPVASMLNGAKSFTLCLSTIVYATSNAMTGGAVCGLRTTSGNLSVQVLREDNWATDSYQFVALFLNGQQMTNDKDSDILPRGLLNSNTVEGVFTLRYDGSTLTYNFTCGSDYNFNYSADMQIDPIGAIEVLMTHRSSNSYPIPTDARVTSVTLEATY